MTDSTIAPDNTPIPTLPPEKVRGAALTVCRYTHDIDDARLLLDALGLAEGDHLATLRTVRPLWPWTQAAIARGQA